MSGLSTLINAGAGAIDGFQTQQYTQNAQDALQQQRTDTALKMAAAQQTYQPQAQAQVAASGLAAAQSTAQTSLVPQQQQLAATGLTTENSAADATLARQPVVNQTADDQAAVKAGFSSAQHDQLPMAMADYRQKGVLDDQTMHVASLNGLWNSMLGGGASAQQYVQKMSDAGFYLPGAKIGQVGITDDGQNFQINDTDGKQLATLPVSSIKQAHAMSIPTEWHDLKPGSTLAGTQGGAVTSQTQAPVPPEWRNIHQPALVQTMMYLAKTMPGKSPAEIYQLTKNASSMSRPTFVANFVKNYALPGGEANANALAAQGGQVYDRIMAGNAPGLSNAPASNSSGNPTIDSLIGNPTGAPTGAPAGSTVDNPFAVEQ